MPTLSLIVPATNRPATLEACVRAIRESSEPPDELIVVDRSPDPRWAGRPSDASRARNAGADRATGEVLVFVDADVCIHREALARIRAAFAADPALVALCGAYDDEPPAPGFVSQYRNLALYYSHWLEPSMFWHAVGAIRKDAFDAVGGLDVNFLPELNAVQDIDLGLRLAASGTPVQADRNIRGTHLKAWSLDDVLRTDFWQYAMGVALILRRRERAPGVSEQKGSITQLALPLMPSALFALALVARRRSVAVGALALVAARNARFLMLLRHKRGSAFAAAGLGMLVVEDLLRLPALARGLYLARAAERRG